jgi:uncharacterized protein YjbI with pentapeptide repeats
MARDPRLAIRLSVAGLAAFLALLGIVLGAVRLGWREPVHAASLAGQALAHTARFAIGAGWPLLVVAAGLAFGVFLSLGRGRAALGRLWATPAITVVRWLFTAAGLLAMLVVVIAVVPPRFTAGHHFDKAADELKAQNDVRTTLLQALAGGVLLLGAYFTYRQLQVTREGQITDRYTKAVDQLGSEHLDVRVGGIYALERIARDSPPDRATIEEVLTAYVRDHAPWPLPPSSLSLQAITQRLVTFAQRQRSTLQRRRVRDTAGQDRRGEPDKKEVEPKGPPADVQAAMTVLGRRQRSPDDRRRLDLARVNLQGAVLGFYADLQQAMLNEANLQDAVLARVNLQGAVLAGANLQRASLLETNLQQAMLSDADLQGAMIERANLHGASLGGVDFQGADLQGANLQAAYLAGANLQDALLGRANLQDAKLQDARLDDANLQGAYANEDTRWPVGWDRAQAEARGVQYPPWPHSDNPM